jgi:hypothetical protein
MAVFEQLYNQLVSGTIAFLPNLLAAIIVLLIGFIVGRVCGWIVKEIIVRSTVEKYLVSFKNINIKFSELADIIVKWLIYLVFIQQATIYLGVAAITEFVSGVLAFLPGVIAASLIIYIGYIIATFIKDRIIGTKTMYSRISGELVFLLVIYISIAMGLKSITGINTTLLDYVLLVLLLSGGIGLAIALGLGLKDVVAKVATEYVNEAKIGRKK